MNRRHFLQASGAAVAALSFLPRNASAYSVSRGLKKFIDPLPRFGVQIPVLTPNKTRYPGVDYYEIVAGQFRHSASTDLGRLYPGYSGTRMYGYRAEAGTHAALGGVIIARKDNPVRIKYRSALPAQHIIPFDSTLTMGMPGMSQDNISVHLHGGLTPWASDGNPFSTVNAAGAPGQWNAHWLHDDQGNKTVDLFYPNAQTARMMWYHDHAFGTTRMNAYAGLASGYLLTDAVEDVIDAAYPLAAGRTMILAIQDKVFYDPAADPGFGAVSGGASAGDLWYPWVYDRTIWKLKSGAQKLPAVSCVPEMFGDTMLVNGCAFPTVNVDRGAYRLRVLNACNARVLNLRFVYADASGTEPLGGYVTPSVAPVTVYIIGTEGGFLPNPVLLFNNGLPIPTAPGIPPLLQAPAERSDLLVDFSQCPAGSKLLLYNDAPAPYPMGNPIFDWFPAAGGLSAPGYGPNTRTLLQFVVGSTVGAPLVLPTLTGANPLLPTVPDPVNGGLQLAATGIPFAVNPVPKNITLNEQVDMYGRLLQTLGTTATKAGIPYVSTPTETVTYGTVEIWNLFNLTMDVHPMHFHLFNVMVLRRRPFKTLNSAPLWSGPGRGPDPGEEGWKETVKVWPGECVTLAVRVEDPMPAVRYPRPNGRPTVTVAQGPLEGVAQAPLISELPVSGRTGFDDFVYHCHILEHEEHDMMRPLQAKY